MKKSKGSQEILSRISSRKKIIKSKSYDTLNHEVHFDMQSVLFLDKLFNEIIFMGDNISHLNFDYLKDYLIFNYSFLLQDLSVFLPS